MDIRQLELFVEIVRQQGFTAAARHMHVTQPTVSKAVAALEDEVGAPLLERMRNGVRLTAAGEAVYRRAQSILNERKDLKSELKALADLECGELHLGLPPVGSDLLFAPMFAEYRRRWPRIELHLLELGSQALEDNLRNGSIELAGSLLPVVDEFDSQPVCCEPLVVVVRRDHPLARKRTLALAELQGESFVMYERGFALNQRIIAACEQAGFVPREAVRSTQLAFMVALVAAGLGVALLPRMIAGQRRHPGVVHVPLTGGPDWNMALVWRRDAFLSHAAQAWLSLARETRIEPAVAPGAMWSNSP